MAFEKLAGAGTYLQEVFAAGSNNTKGSYVQMTGSTSGACHHFWFQVLYGTSTRLFLVDIATGAGGAETVLVANLAVETGAQAGRVTNPQYALWADIPASTRVAIRLQSNVASAGLGLSMLLEIDATASLSTPETYGANTGSTIGTQVDPGASANTKGAYAQLTASTGIDVGYLAVSATLGGNASPAFSSWNLDIATGPGGSETVVIPDLTLQTDNLSVIVLPGAITVPIAIASGTRIAARAACSTNDATDRLIYVTAYGMDAPSSGGGGCASAYAFA